MREIKFRAWDGKEMLFSYSSSTPFNDSEGAFPDEVIKITNSNYGWEWMQFTGLKDKNGKEIYEGDIIECNHIDGLLYPPDGSAPETKPVSEVVSWNNTEGRFTDGHSNFGGGRRIIGNIYENPELLTKQTKYARIETTE